MDRGSIRRLGRQRWQLRLEILEHRQLLAASPIITEIVANNDDTLFDGDDIPSDWIELYNAGDENLDLNGWYLTDDAGNIAKWQFPAVNLDAGRYLIVFASGHVGGDYIDPAGNLHTNFNLSANGEYLALVRPDLSVASEFSPEYPRQKEDISYGPVMTSVSDVLVAAGATARTLIPTADLSDDWTGGDEPFNDSLWTAGDGGKTGVGYSVAEEGTPGLVAEWSFETSEGEAVTDGQLAVGVVDETAGDANGPYDGTGNGDPEGQGASGLAYSNDTPSGIGSSHSLVFPAPEIAANHVRIPMAADDGLATMTIGDFRVEAWFKTTDTGRNILSGSYVGAATSLNLELHTSNRGRIYVQGPSSTTDLNLTLPTNSRDGNWHHLAGVRNGGTVELYYDGALVGSRPDTAGDYIINKPAVFIGRDNRTTSVIFNGSIDDVRFYNSADTSALVAAYDFETAGGVAVAHNQDASGQVDDTGGGAGGPYHGTGSSTAGGGSPDGINYSADVPAILTDSQFSLDIDEGNANVESFNIGMPPAIANLTQGDFTMQAWFKTTDSGRSIMMGSYTGPDNALNFELHTNNRIRVWIQNASGGTTDLNVSVGAVGNSRDGQWHFGTAVRRSSDVELYFDGVLVGQTSDVAGSYVQTAANYYFGRDSRTGETRFDGSLDNIRFWNVALSPEQIADMANGATPGDVTGGAFDALVGTNVAADMLGNNASALVRVPFEVQDPTAYTLLNLRMKYDDGFVAYINGHEVAGRNAPESLSWNSAAVTDRPVADAKQYEDIEIGAPGQILQAGTNILAIHGLNGEINADNFLILPELIGISTTVDIDTFGFFPRPTPGGPNGDAVEGFVDDTRFSVDRGFYEATDLGPGGILENGIELTTATPGATIRYTIDGSWPTATHGTEYTEPIVIDTTTTLRAAAFHDGLMPSNVDTHTYLFLDDVIRQPPNPGHDSPGDPTYPLPFPLTHQPGVAADYEMDPAVVTNPLYADSLKDDLLSIPTLSLVMDMDDIFNQPNGIWSNSQSRGRLWERLTSVEFFDPNDPDREFQVNSAIRIQGRASRVPSSSIKHAFRLIFKDDYGPEGNEQPTGGPTKLNFRWFEGSPVDRFDTIVLRGGYNYSYLHGSNDQNIRAQYIRERFMRDAQIATGQLGSHGSYVHLYVNGLYFGLYAPQERPDASFMAQHLGGDKEDYDVISAGEVRSGSADAWNELLSRAAEDLSIQENYDAVMELLDVESLIDYMIVHIWGGTTDWPAPGGQLRNWVVGRERKDGEGFKFFVWDAEYSIQGTSDNVVNVNDANTPAFIYSRLRANPEFRLKFADHVHKHFFNGGALTPEVNIARYSALADEIEGAIVGESARWGDTRGDGCNPCLRDPLWVNERDWVLNTYMPGRTETVLDQFLDAGLYTQISAPVFQINGTDQYGGPISAGDALTMSAKAATITTDTVLVDKNADVKAFIPSDDSLETGASRWYDADFDTVGWNAGTGVVGFGSDFEARLGLNIQDQWNASQSSVYVRYEFNLDAGFNASDIDRLNLEIKFDDGYVIYVNGQEIHSDGAPASAGWNSRATTAGANFIHKVVDLYSSVDLADAIGALQPGKNVLAIHGLTHDSDLGHLLVGAELTMSDDVAVAAPIVYTLDGTDPRAAGGANVGISYDAAIPLNGSTQVNARALVDGEWSALSSTTFTVPLSPGNVLITEINYNASEPTAAEQSAIPGIDAGDFDYIEIQNTDSVSPINLEGFTLTDGVNFTFTNVQLAPSEYAVIVEDTVAFQERYGNEIRILGQWTGALSNGGEQITLTDAVGNTILDFEYDDSAAWPQRADGAGASLQLVNVDTPAEEFGKPYRWRGSTVFGGTPGREGANPIEVVINEILANTDSSATASDSIELYNPSGAPIDISGWYLSDSQNDFLKYRIPNDTILAADQYLVFDESDFNPTPLEPGPRDFALSGAEGDDVWLVIPNGEGGVASFVDDVHFPATLTGESLGRVPNGSGRLSPLGRNTLGCGNLHVRVGPLVISEINYNPGEPSPTAWAIDPNLVEDDLEYVEVHNPTRENVTLTNWHLRGGVDYDFLDDTILASGETLIVISFNPENIGNSDRIAAFRTHYGLNGGIRIVGGWNGQLSDSTEDVRLLRPDTPPAENPDLVPRVIEDAVAYDDSGPWPAEADGQGSALVRRVATSFAGDAANWIAAPATPGSVDFSGVVAGDLTGDNDITAADIDVLFDAVRRSSDVTFYDLDKNFVLDERDAAHLVESILATHFGDANLDSSVNAADLNQVGIHWQQPTCNGWADGDFTGDGAVTAADLNEIGINWQRSAPAVAARAPRAPLRVQLTDAALATIIDEPRSTDTNLIEPADSGKPDVRQEAADVRMANRWRRVLSRQWRHLRRSASETAAPNRCHEMLDHIFASSSKRVDNSFF